MQANNFELANNKFTTNKSIKLFSKMLYSNNKITGKNQLFESDSKLFN